MDRVIFGCTCVIAGLLLVLIMLLIAAFPNAYDSLTGLGKILVWSGVIVVLAGGAFSLYHLSDK